MPSDLVTLAFLAIVLGAYYVGTVLGFGTTILTVTFGAQLLELDVLLPVVAPLNVALSSYIAIRYHRKTEWRLLLRRILPLVALGVPLGLWLFNLRQVGWLRLVFGVFVTALAVLQLRQLRTREAAARARREPLTGAGGNALLFLGGIIHGLYATAGPLIVYVVGRQIDDKGAFRSTISTMFVPLTTALMVDYLLVGLVTPMVMRLAVWAIVPVLAGVWLGERMHRRMRAHTFKLSVWLLLLAGGVILTGRAVLAM